MKLIRCENYTLDISEEAYLVGPIRKLYNADRTKTKEKFFQQMSVLYFVYDPRSNYSYITDDKRRLVEVLSQEGLSMSEWNKLATKDFEAAVTVYKDLNQTTSLLLLQDTRVAIDKLRQFLRDIDLTEEDDKGKPKYTISNVTSAIKQIPQLAKDLAEAEKTLSKELEEQGKARGGNELSLLDNGINT